MSEVPCFSLADLITNLNLLSLFYKLPSDITGAQSRAGMIFLSLIFGAFTITNMAVMLTQNRKCSHYFAECSHNSFYFIRRGRQPRASIWYLCSDYFLAHSYCSRFSRMHSDSAPVQLHFVLHGRAEPTRGSIFYSHRYHHPDFVGCSIPLQRDWSFGSRSARCEHYGHCHHGYSQ